MTSTLTHNEVILDALQSLLQTDRDSEHAYRAAAAGVAEASNLAHVLHRYAQQRARFSGDLEREIRTYGGGPPAGRSLGGQLRGGWISLKAAITGRSEAAILAACEGGEEVALANYQDALHAELPEYLKEMIRQQHDQIHDALQHLRSLRHLCSSAERGYA